MLIKSIKSILFVIAGIVLYTVFMALSLGYING